MNQALELLRKWQQDADNIDPGAAIRAFDEEVSRGLAGQEGGLPMIPALRLPGGDISHKALTATVIDIGGTRLKCALATVTADGEVSLSNVKEGPVPGLVSPVTEQDFFKYICRFAGITRETENVAVSFSHNMRVLPGCDGEITGWCKEITVTEPGIFTVAGLFRRISGNPALNVRVTNDSVASMLGAVGLPEPGTLSLGLVNGTGFNICWADPVADILYNTEAGDSRAFPSGRIDRIVDASGALPGTAQCEKKVSGVYLQKLISACLAEADTRSTPITPARTGLSLREYCAATDDLTSLFTDEALDRSALIAALCCSALIRRSDAALTAAGRPAAARVIIGTEGSVINKAPNYKLRFARRLKELDGGAHEITLITADLAGLRGCARLMEL